MLNDQQFIADDPITEGSTVYLTGTITDHLGAPVPVAALFALKAWITDLKTGTVINARNGASILNANGGTVHATTGAWTFKLGALDSAIVNTADPYERHRVLVEWGYNAGVDAGSMEFILPYRNLAVL
jgi:hypothetical protein